jgi:hypothetical protein
MEKQFKETAGVPWQSQYGINPSKQNDVSGWLVEPYLLAEKVESAAILVTKNYVYILGGFTSGNVTNNIRRVSFDNNGKLIYDDDLVVFKDNVGTLPVAITDIGYVAAKKRFYLIGGRNKYDNLSSVYSISINPDGTLGAFRTETPLPDVRAYSVCFVIKNKLYVAGGWDEEDNFTNTVYRTTINNDGTLSDWEILPEFPIWFDNGTPLLIKDRIYILGVYNEYYKTSEIYYATYDSNGNIGPWINAGSMPERIYGSAMVCNNNYVFSFGGYSLDDDKLVNVVYNAPILLNGDLGEWKKIGYISSAISFTKPVIIGNKIYLIGGYDGENQLDTVYSADFISGITDYTPYFAD